MLPRALATSVLVPQATYIATDMSLSSVVLNSVLTCSFHSPP